MKNKIYKIILATFLILNFSGVAFAGVVDIGKSIGGGSKISDVSAGTASGGDALEKLNNGAFSILHTIKIVLSGIVLIYLVYLGFQMVMAMGDDGKLASAKKQIYYTVIAFLFINIPGQLYEVFTGKVNSDVTLKTKYSDVDISQTDGNLLVNFFNWDTTVGGVISFIKVLVIGVVIMLFIMAGIGLVSSGGNDERRKKVKNRFINGIIGLIFIGIIESWVRVVYKGDIPGSQSIFANIANLAIFFAGPIAIFFLILGGFWYITSAGDEAKAKKGVAIIKNTFVAIIILLACYAFLKDLGGFTLL